MINSTGKNPIGTVRLRAFDKSHKEVSKLKLPIDDYYDNSHPLIDDDEYRRKRAIRFVHGQIFDHEGKFDQEFKNEYDSNGVYVRSKIIHADGTVIED